MEKFYCPKCQKIFEAKGRKKEWKGSVFGYCWKLIAECPTCQSECDEYRPSVSSNKTSTCNCCSGSCSLCKG